MKELKRTIENNLEKLLENARICTEGMEYDVEILKIIDEDKAQIKIFENAYNEYKDTYELWEEYDYIFSKKDMCLMKTLKMLRNELN